MLIDAFANTHLMEQLVKKQKKKDNLTCCLEIGLAQQSNLYSFINLCVYTRIKLFLLNTNTSEITCSYLNMHTLFIRHPVMSKKQNSDKVVLSPVLKISFGVVGVIRSSCFENNLLV